MLSNLSASGAIAGANLLYVVQTPGAGGVKATFTQVATFINSLFSGDCTVTSGGVVTCAKINGSTFPASGTSGGIPYFSGANAISSSAALTANLPVIGGGAGVAPSVGTRSGNTTAFVTTTGTQTNGDCVKIDASGNHIANGSACGGVTSAIPSTQTGTNYPIVDGDRAKVIYLSNAAAQTPTLPSAATLTNSNGWFVTACNINAGIQTITPTTSTIGGAASYALPGGSAISPRCVNAVSDGTNYSVVPQGNIYQIASGTLAMGTSAVSAGTCGTAATLSAPGVVTTDRITVGFNGDPTATTGYLPTAMLTLVPYPTANNINIKQCNLTASSITPAALTVNVQVNR